MITPLSTLWPRYRESRSDILDWRRNEVAWQAFPALHGLTRTTLTNQRVSAAIQQRLRTASKSTTRRDLAAMVSFWKWCVEQGELDSVPSFTRPEESAPRQRWLTRDEIGEIWFVLGCIPAEIAGPIKLAFLTGQRINACIGLRWDQIQGDIIDFNLGQARRAKNRAALPMTANVRAVIESVPRWGDYVFRRKDMNNPVPYRTVCDWWRAVLKKAEVEHCPLHTIRHSVATQLVAQGVPILEVSKMLGHSSSAITEKIYAKFSPEFTAGAMERMGKMVGGRCISD